MNNDIDLGELLDSLDMESWLDSQAVDYRLTRGRSGAQLNIKTCPTCGNSDSKVYLNAETGLGNCNAGSHPRGETFNKWRFIRAVMSDISGREVVEHIKGHVQSPGWAPKRVHAAPMQHKGCIVLPQSLELPIEGRNLAYLTQRGIPGEIAAYFGLRYCHEGFYFYTDDGQNRRQDFSGRVLIPVYNLEGELVNFQGRDVTGVKEPRYLFPPGLSATGNHLLNGHNVRDTHRVVVGEGAFDVAAIKIAFDQDVGLRDIVPVGTFGKHLSWGPGDTQEAKFVQLQARGVREVTFMWDGELPATQDAIAAGLRLKGFGFDVRIAMLPKGKDPNEVSAEVVRRCFYEAVPLTRQSAVSILFRRKQM